MKIVLAAIGGAAAIMVWGMVFWNTPLPYHMLERLPDEESAIEAIRANFPAPGTYMIPSSSTPRETRTALEDSGMVATVDVSYSAGNSLDAFHCAIRSFPAALIATLIMSWVVSRFCASMTGPYIKRVSFVPLLACATTLLSRLFQPLWWSQPLGWLAVQVAYELSAWLAAGAVIVAVICPAPSRLPDGP